MTLIKTILDDILNPDLRLSNILRKALVLSYELKNDELKFWVENELDGYNNEEKCLPLYRVFRVQSRGDFSGPFNSGINNCPILTANMEEHHREFVEKHCVYDGIKPLESLLDDKTASMYKVNWPTTLIAKYANKFVNNHSCLDAWKIITNVEIEKIIDTARNRLLRFVLTLRDKYPDINISDDEISKIPKEEIASVVFNIIYGGQNVLSRGDGNVINSAINVKQNDLEGLVAFLQKEADLTEDDASALKVAIINDGDAVEKGKFGANVKDCIKRITNKALDGVWNTGIAASGGMITQALCKYYGWL